MAEDDTGAIERLTLFDQAELVGARWWQPTVNESESTWSPSDVVPSEPPSRRKALLILGAFVAVPIGISIISNLSSDDDQIRPSTDLQRESGWDIGSSGRKLDWSGAQDTDVSGGTNWRDHIKTLANDLAPQQKLLPWALPTLLQMPSLPVNATLASEVRPVLGNPAMADGWQLGRALVQQFAQLTETYQDLLLVIDLPGPQAVAVAAALADLLTPVFILDNCPHPVGVVPAHRTLGAVLYLLPRLLMGNATRPPDAPPMLVLDSARLSPYSDAADRFDNRYLARIPTPAQLRDAGVRRVLYLSTDRDVLDDLVAPFGAWVDAGIEVRMVQSGDFSSTQSDSGEPDFSSGRRALYGGSADSDAGFWYCYGWYTSRLARPLGWMARPSGLWRYQRRTSMFSSGFGRVHTSHWGGGSFGSSSSRSGSWTRTGGSSFG
jgi:hypothetical protein